jgi:RNA polymerase sigma-70 factor (ECF subfamily)
MDVLEMQKPAFVYPQDELEHVRLSLLQQLGDLDIPGALQEFFETYWKLIYLVAIKVGLTRGDAENVVQEIIIGIARNMDTFRWETEVCSFREWLMLVTRGRIVDKMWKVIANSDFEDLWNAEWHRNLVQLAIEQVRRKVAPQHYQIFHLQTLKGMPTRRVAQVFGVGLLKVHIIRFWVARLIKQEVHALQRKCGVGLEMFFHEKRPTA